MAFTFSDRHIEEYYHHGFTVFRGILPVSLVSDLRRVCDTAREVARAKHGKQTQRLQPVRQYGEQFDLKPFRDYAELPELADAVQRVLTPRHSLAGLERTGIFFEPAETPWCTNWHRDITERSDGVDPAEFRQLWADDTFFTQINCALYTDTSTWYVPASDGRPDVAGEREAAAKMPKLDGLNNDERERVCLEYARSMPGAVQLVLEAGDLALYRPNGWHIGNYVPYRKRATLHDSAWTTDTRAWYQRWHQRLEELRKKNAS
ncbi:MAG TPA: hypothetical protein VEJ63_02725 [Planctomycetota bacterium]|nr:hypothetical protein [Planctomycetota bacterium]